MGWPAAVSFGLVCLLFGSLWLLPMDEVSPAVELFRLALGSIASFSVISLVCLGTRSAAQVGSRATWRLALSGVGALGVPALLLWFGRQSLSSVMAVATQVSVPVVVAVASATISEDSDLQNRLIPGLVGLAGALLILPVALPGSSRGWTGLACYVAAAGCSGVFSIVCHREMRRVSLASALRTVAGANAIVFGVFTGVWLVATATWREAWSAVTPSGLLSLATESLGAIGVLVLLRLLSPLAVATRFIFVPLVATVEAFFLLHIPPSPRAGFGAVLMLLGGAACLRTNVEPGSSTEMSLR